MGCAALVLDSRRRVLPRLDIGVRRRCRGLDRRGGLVTGGGKESPVGLFSPTKFQAGTDQSQRD